MSKRSISQFLSIPFSWFRGKTQPLTIKLRRRFKGAELMVFDWRAQHNQRPAFTRAKELGKPPIPKLDPNKSYTNHELVLILLQEALNYYSKASFKSSTHQLGQSMGTPLSLMNLLKEKQDEVPESIEALRRCLDASLGKAERSEEEIAALIMLQTAAEDAVIAVMQVSHLAPLHMPTMCQSLMDGQGFASFKAQTTPDDLALINRMGLMSHIEGELPPVKTPAKREQKGREL